jgi:hypothetical protein
MEEHRMIPPESLARLKALCAAASKAPVALAQMDQRGERWQLSTLRPGGVIIGTWLAKPNAELCQAAYEWLPTLIREVEELRDELARKGKRSA